MAAKKSAASKAAEDKAKVEAAIKEVDTKVAQEEAAKLADGNLAVADDEVMYVSRNKEYQPFEILCLGRYIKSVWNADRTRLVWRVKAAQVEAFERHFMVREGRIIKA